MITRIWLTAALGVAFASAISIGARADTCVEKATRLQSSVASLPSSDPNRQELSDSLDMAMSTDADRCEQIVATVSQRLDEATQGGHASSEKPIPNYPNAPADETGGPGFSDHGTSAAGAQGAETGHASEDDPVPNQTEIPASSRGPSYDEENESEDSMDSDMDSDDSSSMETAPEGHASEEDPVPNQPDVSDQGSDDREMSSDEDDDEDDDD
jgi:hypothetical protein